MSFIDTLFALTRAVGWDHGDSVLAVLDRFLRAELSFETGEVAVLGPIGFERYLLSGDPLAGEDILLEARRRGGPLRIDDIRLVSEYPRTRQAMERRGLRSILLVPLGAKGGLEGWIVLGQDYSFAFAGASMRRLESVAAMAGLALLNAQKLTRLHNRLPRVLPAPDLAAVEPHPIPGDAPLPSNPEPSFQPDISEPASPGNAEALPAEKTHMAPETAATPLAPESAAPKGEPQADVAAAAGTDPQAEGPGRPAEERDVDRLETAAPEPQQGQAPSAESPAIPEADARAMAEPETVATSEAVPEGARVEPPEPTPGAPPSPVPVATLPTLADGAAPLPKPARRRPIRPIRDKP
jgi:hypothetical protein